MNELVLECMTFPSSEEMVSIERNFQDGSGKVKKALLDPMFRTIEAIKGACASASSLLYYHPKLHAVRFASRGGAWEQKPQKSPFLFYFSHFPAPPLRLRH